MDLSKLESNERLVVLSAAAVFILGLVSLVSDWGGLMIVPILAAAAALAVLLLPQLSPSTSFPVPKPMTLLVAGAAAALFWVITALSWLDWIAGHLATFDTLQFLVGLVASLVMAWGGWRAFQAAGGAVNPSPPA